MIYPIKKAIKYQDSKFECKRQVVLCNPNMATMIISPFSMISNFPFESFKNISSTNTNIKPTHKIDYIDEYILDRRIMAIYKSMQNDDHDCICNLVCDTIDVLKNAQEIDIDEKMLDRVMNDLYNMTIELSLNHISDSHNRIRNLHYFIVNFYNN